MTEFDQLVAPYYRELHAHCYRMLGSPHDAEDALQDALLGAWRGLAGFEGRASVRSWLYKIATNACLRLIRERPRKLIAEEHRPATTDVFSNPLTEARNGTVATDIPTAVEEWKSAPGKDAVLFGGVSTVQAFVEHNLVDEYWIKLYPVAIGTGQRLFTTAVDLNLVHSKTYDSGIITLRYRPA